MTDNGTAEFPETDELAGQFSSILPTDTLAGLTQRDKSSSPLLESGDMASSATAASCTASGKELQREVGALAEQLSGILSADTLGSFKKKNNFGIDVKEVAVSSDPKRAIKHKHCKTEDQPPKSSRGHRSKSPLKATSRRLPCSKAAKKVASELLLNDSEVPPFSDSPAKKNHKALDLDLDIDLEDGENPQQHHRRQIKAKKGERPPNRRRHSPNRPASPTGNRSRRPKHTQPSTAAAATAGRPGHRGNRRGARGQAERIQRQQLAQLAKADHRAYRDEDYILESESESEPEIQAEPEKEEKQQQHHQGGAFSAPGRLYEATTMAANAAATLAVTTGNTLGSVGVTTVQTATNTTTMAANAAYATGTGTLYALGSVAATAVNTTQMLGESAFHRGQGNAKNEED